MNQYARVYPSSGGGFEVRCSAVRILGFHKTREAAEAQAFAINVRRSEACFTEPRRSMGRAA